MPDKNITLTETNPSPAVSGGGGTRSFIHTETNPSPALSGGGGSRSFIHTETNPILVGGAGGGWRIFTATDKNPELKMPRDTQTMGRTRGLDFRGKGFRV